MTHDPEKWEPVFLATNAERVCAEIMRKTVIGSEMADHLDDYMNAVARAMALPLEDAWRPAVRANLEVSLRLAKLVDDFPLPDDVVSAAVYST